MNCLCDCSKLMPSNTGIMLNSDWHDSKDSRFQKLSDAFIVVHAVLISAFLTHKKFSLDEVMI